ncbi:lamin tail domain-containing protein [Candidatus Peregrinibacteria bacterium]|nr:lamin tail domain-containing protein [Candidatus Peregrinibacteria bacterium]
MKKRIAGLLGVAILLLNIGCPVAYLEGETSVLRFSEIAWMGTPVSANDEWMELYNSGPDALDLTGWTIQNAAGSLHAVLSGAIPAGGYFLLERTDDTSAPDAPADFIYTGSLKNEGESLSLFDPAGQTVDFIDGWHAGDNTTKATMERVDFHLPGTDPTAWGTSSGTGTPRQPNSVGGAAEEPAEEPIQNPAEPDVPPAPDPTPSSENPVADDLPDATEISIALTDAADDDGAPFAVYLFPSLINEIMVNPFGSDEQGEWVEFYNPSAAPVDLGGWYLDDAEGGSKPYAIPPGTVVAPGSYLVLRAPTVFLSFKNSADIVRLLSPEKEVKETVTYADAKENQAYAKNAQGIFVWVSSATPGSANRFPAPPRSYEKGMLVFYSALPNPDGPDEGKEAVTLLNRFSSAIDLSGWKLEDAQGHAYVFTEGQIPSSSEYTVRQDVFEFVLNNSDESIRLFDPAGNAMDEMGWAESLPEQVIYNFYFLPAELHAFVTQVVDGDTFKVNFESREITVRLIGVDTPETVHPKKAVEAFGHEASAYLKQFLFGKNVILQFDDNRVDKYGCLLAYAYSDSGFANQLVVQNGYGRAYTLFPFRFREEFVQLEAEAKAAGLGLWAKPEVAAMAEEETEESAENHIEELITDPAVAAEEKPADISTCLSPYLKIDAILPNPKKNEGVEFIRLANTGTEKTCLEGWKLDDVLGGGSKPFLIKNGAMEGGATRTFRKQETKLALNNSDDCVFLIDPAGDIADQLCYGKTHAGETFTHFGSDYTPPVRASSAKTAAAKSKTSPKPDTLALVSTLPRQTTVGTIQKIDEGEEKIYLSLGNEIIPIAYAESPVDISMAKSLIDLAHPVIVDYYSGETNQLLGLSQAPTFSCPAVPAATATQIPYLLLALVLLGHLGYWFRRRNRIG